MHHSFSLLPISLFNSPYLYLTIECSNFAYYIKIVAVYCISRLTILCVLVMTYIYQTIPTPWKSMRFLSVFAQQ